MYIFSTLFCENNFVFAFSYTNDSPELFQRKLGDLAFLVQNYEFAYNSYHTAKRDFNHEHAWFYFAGALVSEGLNVYPLLLQVQSLICISTVYTDMYLSRVIISPNIFCVWVFDSIVYIIHLMYGPGGSS